MTKILNIISDTNIGGAGHATINYLKAMDKSEFSAAVVLPSGSLLKPKIEALGISVIEISAMADKSFDRAAISMLEAVISEQNPDIVHTHGSLSGRIAAKNCGKTVVFTRHSAFPFPSRIRKTPLRLLYKWLYEKFSDRIIAISPAGAELLTGIGVSPRKIDTMLNGCEPLQKSGAAPCAVLREALGISGSDFVLGIIARIEDYKGHLDILEAMSILRSQGENPKLIIAGSGSFEDEVRARAAELRLCENVIFTGFISDVALYMSILDVQLNASYISEASSVSIAEGLSLGVPCIASDCSGNPFMVTDGKSGLLFPPQNAQALAERILQLMKDPALLSALGAGAKREYEERFTLEKYARTIEDIYRKALAEKEV